MIITYRFDWISNQRESQLPEAFKAFFFSASLELSLITPLLSFLVAAAARSIGKLILETMQLGVCHSKSSLTGNEGRSFGSRSTFLHDPYLGTVREYRGRPIYRWLDTIWHLYCVLVAIYAMYQVGYNVQTTTTNELEQQELFRSEIPIILSYLLLEFSWNLSHGSGYTVMCIKGLGPCKLYN